jgi:hypothetical protein
MSHKSEPRSFEWRRFTRRRLNRSAFRYNFWFASLMSGLALTFIGVVPSGVIPGPRWYWRIPAQVAGVALLAVAWLDVTRPMTRAYEDSIQAVEESSGEQPSI